MRTREIARKARKIMDTRGMAKGVLAKGQAVCIRGAGAVIFGRDHDPLEYWSAVQGREDWVRFEKQLAVTAKELFPNHPVWQSHLYGEADQAVGFNNHSFTTWEQMKAVLLRLGR